jgi:hypothetical protein
MTEIARDRRNEPDDRLSELYANMRGGYAASQATVIEETRAATQVVAAVMAAKRWPRDEAEAAEKMRRACSQLELADVAFWSFPRGDQNLQGMTVQMARALLAIWGNATAGVQELHHDPRTKTTEMRAYATDLETNVTIDRIFTVHWRIDTRQGSKALTDDRSIYENNANLGARRFRECIFDILPGWYKHEADRIARETLRSPDPTKSPAQLAADAVRWFGSLGVSLPRLEARLGKRRGDWDEFDLAQLRVLSGTLKRKEGTADELFPSVPVTSEELLGGRVRPSETSAPVPGVEPKPDAGGPGAAEPAPEDQENGRMFPEQEPPS